ncbi:STAS domain-containing protein [uncultured Mycobacterium sp.]|uniref:STAS domain-containing protein n=1 Tax=uncultured Mycobacterium sp. TaxID=171292 RepID=UPI0035CC9658
MSATDPINISVGNRDGVVVLSVGGEVDLVTIPALEDAIGGVVADNPAALVIDLTAVDFLASAGLRLLAATKEQVGKSAPFAVVARGPATRRPIQLTGLDEAFPLYQTLEDALTDVRDGKLKR